jgi:AcrR family transcriptional regulator
MERLTAQAPPERPPGSGGHAAVVPKTPRGERMRGALLQAARGVFARDGFAGSRISDIVHDAGASNGSFYRYFNGKHEVLMALLQKLLDDFYELARSPWVPQDPKRSMYATTKRYLELYAEGRDLMALLVEVSQTDADVREIWNKSRARFFTRVEGALRRGQRDGVVRPGLDCPLATSLLGAMTEQFAYMSFVLHVEPERGLDEVTEAIVDIWARAVLVEP